MLYFIAKIGLGRLGLCNFSIDLQVFSRLAQAKRAQVCAATTGHFYSMLGLLCNVCACVRACVRAYQAPGPLNSPLA